MQIETNRPGEANPIFTIVTATYNRRRTLKRTYESVRAQTFKNFEWIIVDDGSTDGTEEDVKTWIAENSFPIRFFYQENGGKPSALNRAFEHAKGTYGVVLDSDDEILPHALETFLKLWESIPKDIEPSLSSVVVNCHDQNEQLIGTVFPKSPLYSEPIEVRLKYKVKGDKFSALKVNIIQQYPFPIYKGKSAYEDSIWMEIGKKYKEAYFNESLFCVHLEEPSITRQANPFKNAFAGFVRERDLLNSQMRGFKWSPAYYLRCAANYRRCGIMENYSFARCLSEIHPLLSKVLVILGEIPARMKYSQDRKKFPGS